MSAGSPEAMKVAGWSEAHYVDLMPHNPLGPVCTAATVHLAAAVPNFSWLECRASPVEQLGFDSRELFPQQAELNGSHYDVPEVPGLGIEDERRCAEQARLSIFRAPASAPSRRQLHQLVATKTGMVISASSSRERGRRQGFKPDAQNPLQSSPASSTLTGESRGRTAVFRGDRVIRRLRGGGLARRTGELPRYRWRS